MPPGSVLMFGDINIDNTFMLSEFPAPGRDGYADHIEMQIGGTVCNSALVMQGLGQPTSVLGSVGDDIWSRFIFEELRKASVDSSHVVIKPNTHTGLIFIAVTPNGERTMLSHRGANTAIQPEDLDQDIFDDICLLELSGYVFLRDPQRETAWRLVEMAGDRNIPISMDTGLDPVILAPDSIREVLPHLSVLITGGAEAERLAHANEYQSQINALLSLGPEQVAIKLGHEGAVLGWADGTLFSSAFPVNVLDTTGAGDAFSAGMLYGYLHNFSPNGSLLLANAMGGLATTVYGAARMQRGEVVSFLLQMRQILGADRDDQAFSEVLQHLSQT
jgi:ribokinase